MDKIKKVFLTKTIPDCLAKEYGIPFTKFVFEEKTLEELEDDLKKEFQEDYKDEKEIESEIYKKGLKTILYLWKNRLEYQNGSDDIFIQVHDSNQFFSYLQELTSLYSKRKHRTLLDPDNFIRSIWLRMGVEDIKNVETFLRRQIAFIKNESAINEYEEFDKLNDEDILAYRINENEDWFETNKNIVFSIRRTASDISTEDIMNMDFDVKDYDFPAIHFGLVRENDQNTCYLYGVQQLRYGQKDEDIKEYIQPIRKQLRNKHASSNTLIALSLFFDFLYKRGIKDVVIPTMQVFNYSFHEHLSDAFQRDLDKYSEEERNSFEERYNNGDKSNDVLTYKNFKSIADRYINKQDEISYNKSERLINTTIELCERYPVLNITSYPFIEDESMHIKINGEINILNSSKKKRSI